MKMSMNGHTYPPFRLMPDRLLAQKFQEALGGEQRDEIIPPTFLIFLRAETRGVDLFTDLEIPREKALHGGQRYEWFVPVKFDEELDVTARVDKIVEKQGKRGKIWFADVSFEYRKAKSGELAVREITRLVKQS